MQKRILFKATLTLLLCWIVADCSSNPVPRPAGPDATPPEEVHLTVSILNRDGRTKMQDGSSNTTPSSSPDCLPAGPDDFVVFFASGKDSQGLKDIQIWASQKICTDSGETGQCSQGLTTEPIAHNPHQGDTGMVSTERSTQYTIDMQQGGNTNDKSITYSVTARGINFNNKTTYTKWPIIVRWGSYSPPCRAA
jgi:hypothetical protein